MPDSNTGNLLNGTAEKEVVFGPESGSNFGPIPASPTITFGGTAWRWVTQLSINGEKYGSAEGPPVKENLVVEQGEYIKTFKAYRWGGTYNFIISIRITTNRGKYWVIEHDEAPEKTKEKFATLELNDIRVLSIGGSHGGIGNSMKQLTVRYLDNYFVEDKPEDTGAEKLYAVLDVTGPGEMESFETTESRTLDAITTVSEITASVETEITQSYLLAEATSRLGLTYMNREQIHQEQEMLKKSATRHKIVIADGQLGLAVCEVEIKKMKTAQDGQEHFLIIPKEPGKTYPQSPEDIRKMTFFDLSSNLQLLVPGLKFSEKYGSRSFHQAE